VSLPSWVTSIYFDGVNPTDVSAFVLDMSSRRGRSSPLEEFPPGVCVIELDNTGRVFDPLYSSGTWFGQILPGRRLTVTIDSVVVFDGRIFNWSFRTGGQEIAIVEAEDGLAKLGRASFDAWTTTYGDLPGTRLAAALARPEVGYSGATSLGAGVNVLQADNVSWGSNVLAYCQLVARSDLGYFFASRTNVITFLGRHSFMGVSPAVTFSDTGSGVEFDSVEVGFGRDQLANRVTVDRVRPLTAEEDVEQVSASDATSITTFGGTFTLALSGLLLQSTGQAQAMADYLLSVLKDPLYRFRKVSMELAATADANRVAVLGLDIGSVVSVTYTPGTPNGVGTAITRTCVVDGIELSGSSQSRSCQASVTLADSVVLQTGNFYEVQDATFGAVTAGGALAYPIAF
jgi:hypothetical protein